MNKNEQAAHRRHEAEALARAFAPRERLIKPGFAVGRLTLERILLIAHAYNAKLDLFWKGAYGELPRNGNVFPSALEEERKALKRKRTLGRTTEEETTKLRVLFLLHRALKKQKRSLSVSLKGD